MSPDLAARMRTTTEALVKSFEGPIWSVEASLAPRAPECEHIMFPASLGIPKKNNEEWAARFKNIAGLITDATVTSPQSTSDQSQLKELSKLTRNR